MAFSTVCGSLAAGAVWMLNVGSAPAPANSCVEQCHKQKSAAYQRCRTIPPTDRAARVKCFREADAALRACLRRCR